MYEVVYMKADYEPWWLFDGWEETVLSRHSFQTQEEAEAHLEKLVIEFRERYPKEQRKEPNYYAFWSNYEVCYCDSCDEDLQIFHGLLLLYNGKPL